MSSNKAQPQILSVPQLAEIHLNNPATGKAIQTIIDYINKTVSPVTGTKIKKRSGNAS